MNQPKIQYTVIEESNFIPHKKYKGLFSDVTFELWSLMMENPISRASSPIFDLSNSSAVAFANNYHGNKWKGNERLSMDIIILGYTFYTCKMYGMPMQDALSFFEEVPCWIDSEKTRDYLRGLNINQFDVSGLNNNIMTSEDIEELVLGEDYKGDYPTGEGIGFSD